MSEHVSKRVNVSVCVNVCVTVCEWDISVVAVGVSDDRGQVQAL